jgi:diguanylate cyclase (GGDEF)-like protein
VDRVVAPPPARRACPPLAYKAINDRCGHAAGDAVLCDAVRLLREAIRPEDAVGRLGGDEFAVLLPGASAAIAAQVRDRAELALSVTTPASFGAAAFPADATGADPLFMHADAGIYARKRRVGAAE